MTLRLRAIGATCHMGSHSVSFHPTQVNTPGLNPSQRPILDLPTVLAADAKRLEAFHMKCQCQIMKIRWQDHIRNTEVASLTGLCPVLDLITRCRNVLDTSLGSPKTRQLTKHSGVTSTYLSDTFLIKAGGVVQAAQATDGSTRSAGTTTTYHQLICEGDPLCEVIRG